MRLKQQIPCFPLMAARQQTLWQQQQLTAALGLKWLQGLVAGGAWVHVFPEGHVGYSGRLEPCRWGVGRLVCDSVVAASRCAVDMHGAVARRQPHHAQWCLLRQASFKGQQWPVPLAGTF